MKIITLLMCISLCTSISASHIVGGEATYAFVEYNEDKSEVTFEITFTIYRDQKGIDFESYASFGVYEYTDSGVWIPQPSVRDIPLYSVTAFSASDDPCSMQSLSDIQVESGIYKFNITLPVINNYYKIAYQKCCRNHTINNIESAGTTGAVYDIKISAEAQQMGNNSPVFTALPPTFICVNKQLNYNHSAMDPDGDEIRYSFCKAYVAGGIIDYAPQCCDCQSPDVEFCPPPFAPVTYESGYSYSNPIGGNPVITIDSITGVISGIPDQLGSYVVGVCVTEYRDGKVITKIRRDFEFSVVSCEQALAADLESDTSYYTNRNGNEIKIHEFKACNYESLEINNLSTNIQYIEDYTWKIFDQSGQLVISASGLDQRNPTIDMSESGIYEGLMILNNGQSCTDTSYMIINIIDEIDLDFEYSYDPCYMSTTTFVSDDDLPIGDIVNWQWNFGDGNASEMMEPNHDYATAGSYTVDLTVTYIHECNYTLQKVIDYTPNAEEITPELITNTEIICEGDSIYFDNNWITIAGLYSYIIPTIDDMCDSIIYELDLSFFADPTEVYSEEYICDGDSIIFDNEAISLPGTYTVAIPYQGQLCDSVIQNLQVEFSELPNVSLITDTTITIRSDYYIPLTVRGIYESIEWTPGSILDCNNCMQPMINLDAPREFDVTITNTDGCIQERSIYIDVEENNDFYVANIISPKDGDPKNRKLYVQSRSEINYTYDMRVYDRYGNLIHECLEATCNNINQGWAPENVNPGVFVYVITFTDEFYAETITGGITVLE